MALLDRNKGQIVIRIAYDGPAFSGKTTSVKALSRSLGRPVFSAGEAEGRTLFFDWMDYAGGRFEGHEIRCQVVSVPGQGVLQKRRRALLAEADAVVFVADSTRDGVTETLAAFRSLQRWLRDRVHPLAGVIVQANKRDRPGSVSVEELRERLGMTPSMGITESVATQGTGVRETFIFAVRLALDRVRELLQSKALEAGSPGIDSGEDLLRHLSACEAESSQSPPGVLDSELAGVVASASASGTRSDSARDARGSAIEIDGAIPRPPDASVPSGMIWPPVNGRLMLHDAASGLSPSRTAAGDWLDDTPQRWRLHSGRDDSFTDLEEGRSALIQWARAHTAAAARLSPHRCVVLAAAAAGRWRLWQLVHRVRSLGALLEQAAVDRRAPELAALLLEASRLIVLASRTLRDELAGGPIIDSIVSQRQSVLFTGFMPSPAAAGGTGPRGQSPRATVRRELKATIATIRAQRRADVASIIGALDGRRERETAEMLVAMLLEG